MGLIFATYVGPWFLVCMSSKCILFWICIILIVYSMRDVWWHDQCVLCHAVHCQGSYLWIVPSLVDMLGNTMPSPHPHPRHRAFIILAKPEYNSHLWITLVCVTLYQPLSAYYGVTFEHFATKMTQKNAWDSHQIGWQEMISLVRD